MYLTGQKMFKIGTVNVKFIIVRKTAVEVSQLTVNGNDCHQQIQAVTKQLELSYFLTHAIFQHTFIDETKNATLFCFQSL